jgi:hypothetical protein
LPGNVVWFSYPSPELESAAGPAAGVKMAKTNSEDDWSDWWKDRMDAMEKVLGRPDDIVGHVVIPFQMGADIGGAADVVYFRHHVDGVVCATSELIGCDDQRANSLGNYELMICHRNNDKAGQDWGSNIISQLAHYTCEAELNPGETMDIGAAAPKGSTIAAFLFFGYAAFAVGQREAGLLLCMGITAAELNACRKGKRQVVEAKLKAEGVYPFTDLFRKTVV